MEPPAASPSDDEVPGAHAVGPLRKVKETKEAGDDQASLPPPSPGIRTAAQITRDRERIAIKHGFDAYFARLVADGMDPTEAAVQALQVVAAAAADPAGEAAAALAAAAATGPSPKAKPVQQFDPNWWKTGGGRKQVVAAAKGQPAPAPVPTPPPPPPPQTPRFRMTPDERSAEAQRILAVARAGAAKGT